MHIGKTGPIPCLLVIPVRYGPLPHLVVIDNMIDAFEKLNIGSNEPVI